jgi:DNA-binding NtrC family response regulator
MKDFVLLVVDDDQNVIQAVEAALPANWRLISNADLETKPDLCFHAAIVDTNFGIHTIKNLCVQNPHVEVIAMSELLDRMIMEQCLKAGATRFLAKPLHMAELLLTVQKLEAFFKLKAASRNGTGDLVWIGSGEVSLKIQRDIAQLSGEHGPILIEGESGTGKEVTAQLIHSQDSTGPLVIVNVASIPDHLFESEFFGHVKGAFTGADQNKMGLVEAAEGGDLFLDEIEALSQNHQAKLLRFLESGEARRVGAKETTIIQTRVIAATNRNLTQMVKEGKFRDDLLWRLRGKHLKLPPLRDRSEDVPELARFFLNRDRARQKTLGLDALQTLQEYAWPGNIRELKRACEQLILLSPLPFIRREDVLRVIQPRTEVTFHGVTFDWSRGLPQLINDHEAVLIKKALEAHRQIDDVAKVLQISRSSLYKKIKDHNIDWKGD